LCTKAGKNFADFPLTINVNNRVPYTIENVKKYEAAGISMMFIPRSFQADVKAMIENMENFAKEIKDPLEKQR
jgi:2-methylisocitrate lyase-like PEP mutase family enzyme